MIMRSLTAASAFAENILRLLDKLWDALTSKTALLIYIAFALVFVVFLVARIIFDEQRRARELKYRAEADTLAEREAANKTIRDTIDKSMQTNPGIIVAGGGVAPSGNSAAKPSAKASGGNSSSAEEENEGGSRFYMLTEIDKEYELYVRPEYDDGIGLRELCEVFRNFAAGKLKLYYDRRYPPLYRRARRNKANHTARHVGHG